MLTAAALLLPLALQASVAAPPASTDPRYQQCLELIDSDAERAYEEGMAWATEGNALNAYRCAALALIAQNRIDEGARRLESLGQASNPADAGIRAELFSQAGNAWLLAEEPSRARSAFSRAIATMAPQAAEMPDLLIDRARAYAMEQDYRHAEEDLSGALDRRPNDPLALRLRASARMHQSSFELAEADAQAAFQHAVTEQDRVDAALVLGHVRESVRTGAPVTEQ